MSGVGVSTRTPWHPRNARCGLLNRLFVFGLVDQHEERSSVKFVSSIWLVGAICYYCGAFDFRPTSDVRMSWLVAVFLNLPVVVLIGVVNFPNTGQTSPA